MKYLVNRDNFHVIEVENENDMYTIDYGEYQRITRYTNLEHARNSIKPISLRDRYITQDSVPIVDKKYWKWDDAQGLVVEMSQGEKDAVDTAEAQVNKRALFKGKEYRITVTSNGSSDTGFDYVCDNYPKLISWCTGKQSIITDIDENSDSICYVYVDELEPQHQPLVYVQTITSGDLTVGKYYKILGGDFPTDFTSVGASSNSVGVCFIATGTTPTWGTEGMLSEGDDRLVLEHYTD